MLRKLLTLTFAFLLSAGMAFAQSSTITGTVVDAQSGEPLAGANVFIQGLSTGAATNANGVFEIDDVPYGTYTFRTTFVGYRTVNREVEVDAAEQTVNFELQPDLQNLDQVVVSGIAGETSRAVSQIAVSKVNAEQLQEANTYSSVSELLTGKAAGVNIQPASGNPGGGVRFNIRSGGSLGGDGQPVIYIDGTRINNAEVEGFGVGGQGIGVLSDLNPNDIASVEILKGPAAAALYGSRGSNGVVLIETKSGKGIQGGDVNVDFRSSYGLNTKQESYEQIDILSAEEADSVIDSNPFYDNTISVSGGTEYVRYFTSLNQRYAEGLGPQNKQDRQSFRGNFEAYPNDQLTVRANTSFTMNEIQRPQNDNNIFGWLGNLILAPGGNTYVFTPRPAIEAIEDKNDFKRFVGSVSATWTPIENLNFNGSIGYDNSNLRQTQFYSPNFGYAGIINGERAIYNRDNEQITYDANISYLYTPVEDLQITSIVGTQIFNRRNNTSFISKNDFASSSIKNVGSGALFISGDESNFHARDAGLFTQHDLNFDDTFFVSLGGRLDYASAIGDEAPQIFYPQARVAVRLDQFDFLPETFDLFKVRAAYGETGALPALLDGVNLLYGASAYANGRGAVISEVGNPEIVPERVKELEVGLDIDFLNNYGAQITYYNQNSTDAIIDFEQAPSTGLTFDDPPLNVGGVRGQGVEFGFNGTPILTENTQLDFNITASYQTNEVEDLGGAQPIFDGFDVNVIKVGLPRSAFYVNTVDGALRDDQGNIVTTGSGAPVPNVSAERQFLGQPYPEYNGSFSMTFRFLKNFELYQLWDWATGLSVYDNTEIFTILFANNSEYTALQEAFSNASPGTAEYRSAADALANSNPNYDGNFIEDADYVKLRELSLSYDFSSVLANSGLGDTIRNLRLSVAGRNLLTFTEYDGIDPEVNFTGSRSLTRGADFLTLQVPRTFYGTINIGF